MNTLEKKIVLVLLFVVTTVSAQIGVGTKTPHPDAMLEVKSTNKGLLLPRLALSSTTSMAPLSAHIEGMSVYNTATTGDVTPGFYYNDGGKWIRLSSGMVADATTTATGKIQLAGDLSGTAALPTIAVNAITSSKVADNAITDAKITAVSGAKITGNILGNAANVTGIIGIANGGTGAATAAAARTNLGLGSAATNNSNDFEMPLTISAPLVRTANAIAIPAATGTVNGYLSATDFNTFSNKINSTEKAANNGVATLGNDGKIPSSQIPAISFQSVNVVTSQSAMIAIAGAQVGSIAIRTDVNKNYVLSGLPASTLSNWLELSTPNAITTVNGNAGPNISLTKSDIVLGNVDNTSDINKPISLATQTALDLKENSANKSTDITADATSTTKYPSVKVIKDYVDSLNAAAGVADGSITSAKIANATIVNADVSATAAIDFTKINIQKADILGLGIVKADLALGNVDNTTDVNKPVSTATQTALNLKANVTDVTSSLMLKEEAANKSTATTLGTSDVLFPTQNAVKTYVDGNTTSVTSAITAEAATARAAELANATAISTEATTARAAEATLTTNLATEATTARAAEAANATAIALKENAANKTLDLTSADGGSDVKFPSAKAVKTYADGNITTVTSAITAEAATARAAELANATAIALKEDAANKTLDLTSADGGSDVKFPSAKAVKTYADAKVVDSITDAVTTSAPSQNAVFDALALKASVVDITTSETKLSTKVDGGQLYAVKGSFTATGGTTYSLTKPTAMSGYYSITILDSTGKTFRRDVKSLNSSGSSIAMVTGSGFISERYPTGTYNYVLEYFK